MKEEQASYEPPSPFNEEEDLATRLLQAQPATGRCYVLTFSPRHNITLADMATDEILPVVDMWTRIYATHVSSRNTALAPAAATYLASLSPLREEELSLSLPAPPIQQQLRYMQIFENKGAAMGCSNPHPHCQVWATSTLPEEPSTELRMMSEYRAQNDGKHLLSDYAQLETSSSCSEERVVWQNEGFLVVCPWWAIWPFEILVLPKRHVRALVDLRVDERRQLAEAVQEVTRRYDNLFECHFPYSRFFCCFFLP